MWFLHLYTLLVLCMYARTTWRCKMRITLKNFQSWADQTIDLIDGGVNVAIGENNDGKSVPVKAIQFALTGEYLGDGTSEGMIRRGCLHAFMHVEFADGREWKVTFYHTIRVHEIKVNGKFVQYSGKVAPQEVCSYLRWYVDTDPDLHIVTSIVDLDKGLPFVNKSAKYNYAYMRPLIESPIHEQKKRAIEEGLEQTRLDITSVKLDISQYSNMLQNTPLLSENELKESILLLENNLAILKSIKSIYDSTLKLNDVNHSISQLNNRLAIEPAKLDFMQKLTQHIDTTLTINMYKAKLLTSTENELTLYHNLLEYILTTQLLILKNKQLNNLHSLLPILQYRVLTLQIELKNSIMPPNNTPLLNSLLQYMKLTYLYNNKKRTLAGIRDRLAKLLTKRKLIAEQIPDKKFCPDCGADLEGRL